MLGWFNAARISASRWNRASRSASVATETGSTLMATWRFRSASVARYTSPMPPDPRLERISDGPRRVAEERASNWLDSSAREHLAHPTHLTHPTHPTHSSAPDAPALQAPAPHATHAPRAATRRRVRRRRRGSKPRGARAPRCRLRGDEDDGVAGLMKPLEQRHDLEAGLGLEVAGRLVGQQDRRVVHERARDGDALALSARQLVGPMRMRESAPLSRARPGRDLADPSPARRRRPAATRRCAAPSPSAAG